MDRYLDWQYLEEVRNIWKGPIVLKGLMDNRDALKAKDYVDAIYLSNHGGRQLDIAPSPLQVLPNIRKDLGNDFPILIDSGFYSGQDVVKGLMLGADFVMIGRPALMAMAAYEKIGLYEMIDLINHEIGITMAQLGKTIMSDLSMKNVFRTPFQ